MSIIVPAILPTSREDLEEKLARFDGLVDTIQIDVVDGRFASPASWPYGKEHQAFAAQISAGGYLPRSGQFRYDIDLMVFDPEQVAGMWLSAGASRITIHAEGTQHLPRVVTDLQKQYGYDKDFTPDLLSFGLAVSMDTDTALIEPYVDDVDYVQLMGIATIGKQGQAFDARVIPKLRAFKKKHPHVVVQIDGGVTLETAPALLAAGADRLVVGSDLLRAADIAAELARFEELLQRYGRYE